MATVSNPITELYRKVIKKIFVAQINETTEET